MWLRPAYWSGVLLIAVAVAAVPSVAIVESYVGGSALHGFIEDGRYFVDPGHNQPITEVSESTWRTVWWVEWVWPFSALLPAWIGIVLTAYGMGPNWKPAPVPPGDPPPWFVWSSGAGGVLTVAGGLLCWKLFRTPWVTMLVAYILFCIGVATVTWVYTRSLRRQSAAEPDAAPDPARE
jgi:hypothetical protein